MAARGSQALMPVATVDEGHNRGAVVLGGITGGGLEGAERTSRETVNWNVSSVPPDRAINGVKETADARSTDMVLNDGFTRGALATEMDGVVGNLFRLNSKIRWQVIPGATKEWAAEAQRVIEERFSLIAESPNCWLDASGMNTFTGMVRLAVAGFVTTGEVLATAEWIKAVGRPCCTAVQMISPTRLRNPDWSDDSKFLRRGIEIDRRGKPVAYWIQSNHPFSFYPEDNTNARRIVARKPWGRLQVIHIIEQIFPDQHRGVAEMVAALKKMKMTKHFQEVTLQNAVLNATYAAAIESEMPTAELIAAMGGGEEGYIAAMGSMLSGLQAYLAGAENIALDPGVMIPHLYPGTKLNLKTLGTPGGVGTTFEESLMRHSAAALGQSYEEFTRDFRRISYAGGKLSDGKSAQRKTSRKRTVADRFANCLFRLWLEEDISNGNIPLPSGLDPEFMYEDPLFMEAISGAQWIGGGRGQIDEMKETQAAILRIKSRLSTYEIECARLGYDFREIFEQTADEQDLMAEHEIIADMGAAKNGSASSSSTLNAAEEQNPDGGNEEDGNE